MRTRSIIVICSIVGVFVSVAVCNGGLSVPVIFFSDLTDGPISGWEESSTKGAAVSIWGLNFGSSRGSGYVTCGGVNLTNDNSYAEWGVVNRPATAQDSVDGYTSARGMERITFWLNSSMSTGACSIKVTTSKGTSNGIPFFCRDTGNIYFISRSGDDNDNGLYASPGSGSDGPWFSAKKVRWMEAGDVTYFREGVWDEEDNWSGVIYFNTTYSQSGGGHTNGKKDTSISMVSYPGEFAQIGNTDVTYTIRHGLRDTLVYWTFSKFILRSPGGIGWNTNKNAATEQSMDSNIRFIGNDASNAGEVATIFDFAGSAGGQHYLYLYGNHAHDAGTSYRGSGGPSSYPLYIEGYGYHDHLYIAWNEFCYNGNGRGMQIYGHCNYDSVNHIYIHDNYIHHNAKTGAILGGGDDKTGEETSYEFIKELYFYNNILAYNGDVYTYPGILMGGESWGSMGGKWYIYNNILYKHSEGEFFISVSSSPKKIIMKNNIIVAASGRPYYTGKSGSFYGGSNNCYYNGTGGVPSWDNNSFERDPKFSNSNSLDFHLQPTSPCIDNASWDVSSIVTQDYEGISRPQGSAYDIGPYEVLADLPPDTIPPVISNVACSDTTDSSATITWMTNEHSDSQVEYDTTLYFGSSTSLNSNLVKNHSQTLNGLKSSTKYYYRVKSKDASDNLAVSDPDSLITKPGQPGQPRWW